MNCLFWIWLIFGGSNKCLEEILWFVEIVIFYGCVVIFLKNED